MPEPLFQAPSTELAESDGISRRIAAAAAAHPEAVAVICDDYQISWREQNQRYNQIANGLLAEGLKPGDKVATLARNCPEYVELFFGIIRAGMCAVPLSTMADAPALQRMFEDSGAKALFLSADMRVLLAPITDWLDQRLPATRFSLDFAAEGWRDFATWRDQHGLDDPEIVIGLNDDFNIIYSSGTTGVPKGIMHSNGVRTFLCDSLADIGIGPDAITVLSTPFYSNTTLALAIPTVALGGTLVIMRRFDVDGFLARVEQHKCTHTMLVPVQYQRIMTSATFANYDLASMQMKFSTSAPLREAMKRDIVARFPGLMIEIYGLTEGGGATTLNCNEFPDKLASVGQPGLGTEIKVIDPDSGEELAAGELGELVARSANMMTGYYNLPEKTKEILWRDKDGQDYFRSGDVGRFDADGFLFLGDRIKDIIISGGFNIYANDLELELLKHPDIVDAAVVAVPSDAWGETPLAFVVLRNGVTTPPNKILDTVNANLGKAQRISELVIRDSLPRSTIGKILKRELRAAYWPQ
jgi:long-chain acyl-CoA synthetase